MSDKSTGFKVAPKDVEGMGGLLDEQADHFTDLATYARTTCGDTNGMTNLMSLLAGKAEELAGWCAWKLRTCQARMEVTVASLQKAGKLYEKNDAQSKEELLYLFGQPLGGVNYPELTHNDAAFVRGRSYHADDEWEKPAQPSGADPGLQKLIDDRRYGLVSQCEDIWALNHPDQTLVQKLIVPITGDYSRLYWFFEAYRDIGNSTYSVAENLRRGTLRIGSQWDGPAAANFEYHMFEWHQGTGGLADLFEMCSLTFNWIYEQVMKLVNKILDGAQDLIDRYFPRVREILDRNPGSYDTINCAPRTSSGVAIVPDGVMSDDDMKLFMKRMHEAAQFVEKVRKGIDEVRSAYEEAVRRIGQIWTALGAASKDPVGYIGDTIYQKGQNRAIGFERAGGKFDPNKWNPAAGVWRATLLPS
ncbi:hypothetical protein LWP59_22890 [Amycolatopsis acidiphila]|nr:hypothetical protein [Amycolatopsis acidiphila]UIJ57004.1 hypothetical protein LWP59_22890 [Amycolatopsis acidiphila]